MTEKKRGRPKKLPKEIQTLVSEVTEKSLVQPIKENIKEVSVEKSNENWDFKLTDNIDFFDPTKTYELSKYKPIDSTHGLDFKPEWFLETRETFIRTGHYCEYRFGSKAFSDFWNLQFDRCRNGMTSHGYTITGDHYFFLTIYKALSNETIRIELHKNQENQ